MAPNSMSFSMVYCATHLASEVDITGLQHVLQEVYATISRGFGTDKRTAELNALARKYTLELVGELLVHAEHIAYLTATYSDVTRGNVLVGTNVAIQLCHESLAESHHLRIALATGREVGPMGKVVREFLKVCSNARNFKMERLTDLWKRIPPLYGPMTLLCCTR